MIALSRVMACDRNLDIRKYFRIAATLPDPDLYTFLEEETFPYTIHLPVKEMRQRHGFRRVGWTQWLCGLSVLLRTWIDHSTEEEEASCGIIANKKNEGVIGSERVYLWNIHAPQNNHSRGRCCLRAFFVDFDKSFM